MTYIVSSGALNSTHSLTSHIDGFSIQFISGNMAHKTHRRYTDRDTLKHRKYSKTRFHDK